MARNARNLANSVNFVLIQINSDKLIRLKLIIFKMIRLNEKVKSEEKAIVKLVPHRPKL